MSSQDHSIFLSYSDQDFDTTVMLKEFLERHGFKCWIAKENLPAGPSFSGAIARAIETCQQMIVVMSRSACSSRWVERECIFALDFKNKPVHVVRIDDASLPIYLIAAHAVDLTGGHRTEGMQQLLRDLKRTADSAS